MDSNFNSSLERVMSPEHFNQVVSAILDGKYSWACLLILRFAGYNPLHYIPYRTYNRLMKENKLNQQSHVEDKVVYNNSQTSNVLSVRDRFSQIEDLGHLETLPDPSKSISGGNCYLWDYYEWN